MRSTRLANVCVTAEIASSLAEMSAIDDCSVALTALIDAACLRSVTPRLSSPIFPTFCLVINSPPYWTAVEYDGGRSWWAYDDAYLDDIQAVWNECARVLRPNGKLCINAPIMPIPERMNRQHTRYLKNIAFDMEGIASSPRRT